jgi:NADPH2 dehydrogenase
LRSYPRVASFKTVASFRAHLESLGINLPLDDAGKGTDSPLAIPIYWGERRIGNRWCIHPMEGWDGTADGNPTELTVRRWQHFGESGAKLIWGGEAAAVRHDGRANPRQLCVSEKTKAGLAKLHETLVQAHKERYGQTDDLLVGLQLTHSGRYSKPNEHSKPEPRIAYHHPLLDARTGVDPNDNSVILTDTELDDLIADYVRAAKTAWNLGFDFVDVKQCHGYLGHELLSAYTRAGRYGGSFSGRTNFLRSVCTAIKQECPGLLIGVRLSAFDSVPFQPDPALSTPERLGPGIPMPYEHLLPYVYGFGCNQSNPLEIDLSEPKQLLDLLRELGVTAVNVTAASPYYNHHLQRPTLFPPSDGYQPPEDPLLGVYRQITTVAELKRYAPDLLLVGTGYTYLQEYLPHVAQAVIAQGWADSIGIGRMVLSYPSYPADVLADQINPKLLCRTFSDCTTAPRKGLVSGCYPLDEYYKQLPEKAKLIQLKKGT